MNRHAVRMLLHSALVLVVTLAVVGGFVLVRLRGEVADVRAMAVTEEPAVVPTAGAAAIERQFPTARQAIAAELDALLAAPDFAGRVEAAIRRAAATSIHLDGLDVAALTDRVKREAQAGFRNLPQTCGGGRLRRGVTVVGTRHRLQMFLLTDEQLAIVNSAAGVHALETEKAVAVTVTLDAPCTTTANGMFWYDPKQSHLAVTARVASWRRGDGQPVTEAESS